MAVRFSAADFNPDQPWDLCLLGSGGADMEALADAVLVVEGRRLPVHSQVLSLQSGVLRGMFADLLAGGSGSGSEALVGSKRKAHDPQQDVPVIEAPFQESTLFDAALFLCFCYQPADLAALSDLEDCLPALLRLAHKLDAPQIQRAVYAYVKGLGSILISRYSAPKPWLLELAVMAYRCQLHELSMCCAVEAARKLTHCSRLSNGPGKLSSTYPAAALAAERCDKGMLVQLVWLLAHTAMPGFFPDPEAAAAALQKATQPSFEWSLEDFSQWVDLGIDVGESVRSPWFWAAGKRWRFKVYPSADEYEAHGHLSVYLSCKEGGVRAAYSVTLVDQDAAQPQDICFSSDEPHLFDGSRWGWSKFASQQTLRSRPGYLAGDRLVLRATIQVVQ